MTAREDVRRPRAHRWMLLGAVVALVAGHGVVLRYAASRPGLTTAALSVAVVVLAVKLLVSAHARRMLPRRRPRR